MTKPIPDSDQEENTEEYLKSKTLAKKGDDEQQ